MFLIEKTKVPLTITDNKNKIIGVWFKIKSKSNLTGYVFNGFLEDCNKINTNIVEFKEQNNDYDYSFIEVENNGERTQYINNLSTQKLNRGDIIEIKWKKEVRWEAGDGESPFIAEIVTQIKKTKKGSVSKFKEKYSKPLKFVYNEKISKDFIKDKIYPRIEYYLSKSKNELLNLSIDNKEDIGFTVESSKIKNKEYVMLGIYTTSEHKQNTIQWLYYDSKNEILHEYDLPNDKLVMFEK